MLSRSRSNVPSRWPIIAVLALALVLSVGCSTVRFAYNQMPDLAYWWLDGYADFNDPQTSRVRDGLTRWFAWHRRTQLPDYASLLARAQAEVLSDMPPERMCAWWSELRTRMNTGVDYALPIAAEIALSLTPAQIEHLRRRHTKANQEFRDEYLSGDSQERLQASVKRTVERAELLYGRLDEAQRERVKQGVAASPFDPELWLTERQRRQQDAVEMLSRLKAPTTSRDLAEAALRAYAQRVERSPREAYRRYMERLDPYNCSLAAALHNSTSPAQRQVAAAKLKGWEGDLRALTTNGAP